jgi:predicted RNA-binding Zn-ribbon protein involved in translation (DUF1610 family)
MSEKDDVANLLTERGVSAKCPSCGKNEWDAFGALGNLHVVLQAATPGDELVQGESRGAFLSAYAFTCHNCGFVRLHSRQALES